MTEDGLDATPSQTTTITMIAVGTDPIRPRTCGDGLDARPAR